MDMIIWDRDCGDSGIDWVKCENCELEKFFNHYRCTFDNAYFYRNNELIGVRGNAYAPLGDFYKIIK